MAASRTGQRNFLDSNIWLHALIKSPLSGEKSEIANELISNTGSIVISSQIIIEVCANLLRKGRLNEIQIREIIADFCTQYPVAVPSQEALLNASRLREKHGFSYWDSLLISSALIENVTMFYSEDMHDGMVVNGQMKIVNPFKSTRKGKS